MSVIRGPRTRREYALFFVIWFSIVASGLFVYFYTSNQYAHVAEIAICPTENAAPLAAPAVVQQQTPYICGTRLGNARRRYVSIELYKANDLVAQTATYLYFGHFSKPVARQPSLDPGHYIVRIVAGGNQLMAETSFTVER